MANKLKIAIAGGAGYVGGEMCRLLLNHPNVELTAVQSSSNCGNYLYDVHSDLFGDTDIQFCKDIPNDIDVLFLCMGHGKSKEALNGISDSVVVIDLGNDFRLNKDKVFGSREFVYGLVDSFRDSIVNSKNIANPGCFATAIQSGVMPLAKAGLLVDEIHVSATTGSTGAGQSLSPTAHFSYRTSNLSTYKNFSHQHLAEIKESINSVDSSFDKAINFIPYRGDFARGIIATIHTRCSLSASEANDIFKEYYKSSPFIHVTDGAIHLKQVVNTNKVIVKVEKHDEYLLITVVEDNLLKGACGQAVENMNIIFGLDQKTGLNLKPLAF